ncbi:hypothetical protein A0J61_03639 [Choanephora cucurbitarum]|uniref:BZIP domain-containing protein n=1 Tax=Choanephora cucurbitarum TaxID=101091 RepID=A0A1C7NH36_9FUNG|nr:hypothetical protein A0J61_03639 [Choanephora cucurbitarum]
MNFEDVVDMEWVDSHTASIDASLLPPSPPLTSADTSSMITVPSSTTTIDLMACQQEVSKDFSMLELPSLEQIKQLIEIAKKELAFREQMLISQMESSCVTSGNNNLSVPDTVSPESLVKLGTEEASTECEPEDSGPPSPSSVSSFNEQPMTLEAYAKIDGIDIRSLTSKERRQLRNKISARNFRIRRKEGQVDDQKKKTEDLMHRLNIVEEENKQLKLQIESLKLQNHQLTTDKDFGLLGSKSSETYRQDTSILVS